MKQRATTLPYFFLVGLLTSPITSMAITLPDGCVVKGNYEQTDVAITGQASEGLVAARLKGDFPSETSSILLRARVGKQKVGVEITLKDSEGKTAALMMRPFVNPEAKDSDTYVSLHWGKWGRFYVRPNPYSYKPDEQAKRKEEWDQLPVASESPLSVELRPVGGGEYQVWIEGQLMAILELSSPAISYEVALAPEARVESLQLAEAPDKSSPLALPVSGWSREGEIANARLEIDPKAPVSASFRKLSGAETKGIAVGGLGTFNGLGSDDLQSFFWRRHASHQLPEQRMFAVPLTVYSHAWILCAAEEEEGKVPEFTLRVTRYANSRGNAMADTIVRVPTGAASPADGNVRQVGVVLAGPEGARRKVPLWLINVPIRNGVIADLLHADDHKNGNVGTSRYLDVELLDPLPNVDKAEAFPPSLEATGRAWRPSPADYKGYDYFGVQPPAATSSVTVYGIELEQSPIVMTVQTNTGHQVFYKSDEPEFIANVKGATSGTFDIQWEIADISGQTVDRGAQAVKINAAGEDFSFKIPVKQDNGWYAARVRLVDSHKTELLDYRTSFVMLPPDTRKAGLESPFCGFWFAKNQGSDIKLDEAGPLLKRLGIRRTEVGDDMPESVTLPKYGFTQGTIPWVGRDAMIQFRDGKKTLEEAVAMHEAAIRKELELWPSMDRVLIFHESGPKGAPFPSELWDEPARNHSAIHDENSPEALLQKEGGGTPAQKADSKEWQQNWPKRIEYLTAMAKMIREKFPQLKMQYGNDGNSLGLVGELLRQKFPRSLMDTIAIEDLGQTFAPERGVPGGLQSAWYLRETARKMGYTDLPVTACTEWIGRMTERLGDRKQAEWKARDGLLALAYGFDTISFAGINDASSGYYYSIWGNGGLCRRYPTMAPKPSYAAVATLTQVLDQAKFQRFVPTGSTVLYVLEFRRGEEWVYAIWTPRGEREVSLEFPDAQPRTQTDLYGRMSAPGGKPVSLKASPAPLYLASKNQIVAVTAGRPTFPADPAPAKPEQVIPLESMAEVSIISDKGMENGSKGRPGNLPHYREGEFALREVNDPEMGNCLEIELKPTNPLRWPVEHDYVVLKLTQPVPTLAKNAGVWIKGNGSWGEVDIRKTQGWGPWGTNVNLGVRWPGDASLNFDGWNFIRYPFYAWAAAPGTQNSILGLTICVPRNTLYGTEMVPVENRKIRIKSILLF